VSDERIDGLRQAVDASPHNPTLRLVLAETLAQSGRFDEAAGELRVLLDTDTLQTDSAVTAGEIAVAAGELQLASRLLERAKQAEIEGVEDLQAKLERALRESESHTGSMTTQGESHPPQTPLDGASVTFADVGGLDAVKRTIHRAIILPFQRPELYLKYGRKAGGGAMLYGPPGCGKTLLARATAGECGLPFFNIRIEAILSPFMGDSEQNLHGAFEQARASAPCVLFIDELDAIAFARRKQAGGAGRPLVDQLLQELDAIGSDNSGLLILSATNAPWDVDDALKRPGRLDRPTFVPPPDETARRRILHLALADKHAERLDLARLANLTPLFSGADLRALVEAAVDNVIDEAIDLGHEPPLSIGHFEAALPELHPTTAEWLASARNYVEFANQTGRYDEVAAYLRSKEAKRLKHRTS
jgi:transitional endoplasmic reticulum ATPase